MYDIHSGLEEPWRRPHRCRLGGAHAGAVRSYAAYAPVLEAEVNVDGAFDGLDPLLRHEHRHLLHHRLDVAPSPPMYKARPRSCVCSRYEREDDVSCGREKEKEENKIRERIRMSTRSCATALCFDFFLSRALF
jgi:hypothetical protein